VTTYRALLALPEFRVLFVNRCVVMLSVAASGLALATITYDATGSPVLTALSMFGGPLVSLAVSHSFLAGSDAVRPRTALMAQMAAPLVANLLQAVPGMPWPTRFLLLAIPYAVNAVFSGTQWVVVRDVVPEDGFLLARSALNLAVGSMQVVGYGLGGVLLLRLSPQDLFLLAALADAVCLANVRLGLRDRPARARDAVRAEGIGRRTRRVNGALLSSPVTRPLYVAGWVPNGLVVGCEALYVPWTGGHGAGWLFAGAAAGMMVGDLVVGRVLAPDARDRILQPLRALLPAPYLLFLLHPPLAVAVTLTVVASVGYGAALPLQERLFRHTHDDVQGQAMGLWSQGIMVGQAVAALLGGVLASLWSPTIAMGLLAVASLAVTAAGIRGLRRSAPGTPLAAVGAPPAPAPELDRT
jgi:predicted MFS family arabinose efflux permease